MSIKRAQVSGIGALAAWLNENAGALLSGVSKVGAQETYQAADLDGNIVFKFTANDFTAYRTNGANPVSTNGGNQYFSSTTSIIMCDNGIILDSSYYWNFTRKFGALIAKTNTDKIACVFSYGGTDTQSDNYLYKKLQHVALGDSTTISTTTTFTPESGNQTVITPFITNADVGGKSYTPSAGYMPAHSNYGSGLNKFLFGADMYITNGYWCIKDGGAE